jgi:hypothetical protein
MFAGMFPLSQATQKVNLRRLLSYECSSRESSKSYIVLMATGCEMIAFEVNSDVI